MTSVAPSRPPTRRAILEGQLGWRWRRVAGSGVAHLVPAHPGRLSRTACHRLPVTSDDVLETPAGLLTEVALCQACAKDGAA